MATKLGTILADFSTSLATEIAIGGTTATLSTATDDDGVALPSGRYFFTIDGSNSSKEHISCDLSGTSLTNIKSVSRQGVETNGSARKHRIGATVSITDFAHIKFINDLISGTTTLNSSVPLGYDGNVSISTDNQLATKKYADDLAIAGAPKASETQFGITKLTVAAVDPLIPLAVGQNDPQLPSQSENDAMAGGGAFGTPSSSNKFLTQEYASSATGLPVVRAYLPTTKGSTSTRFDITNPSGTTFRYTWDGTGTDPVINSTTIPTGTRLSIYSTAMTPANLGTFTVTSSGSNYFEVTNASGVAENDKALSNGYLQILQTTSTWTKPSGLKYIRVQVQAGGGGGSRVSSGGTGGGGGAGGYSERLIATASLGSTETITIGNAGFGGDASVVAAGTSGGSSSFGSLATATGGTAAGNDTPIGGAGGTGSSGDLNITGGIGGDGASSIGGYGGNSKLGFGGGVQTSEAAGRNATLYGAGGGGAQSGGGSFAGGFGSAGAIIVTEYYS